MQTTLIQAIMMHHEALQNCRKKGNAEWADKHTATLKELYSMLPSGSGIDSGTTVVDVHPKRLKLSCSFHHMNDVGMYDGWTEHTIRVTPGWRGIEVTVGGRNRNEICEYLHEVYSTTLSHPVEAHEDGYRFIVEKSAA